MVIAHWHNVLSSLFTLTLNAELQPKQQPIYVLILTLTITPGFDPQNSTVNVAAYQQYTL